MRVGIITYGLDRPLTGIGRYTAELIHALQDYRHLIDFVFLGPPIPESLMPGNTIRQISLPGSRLLPGLITVGNLVVSTLSRQLSLDIVHDPTGNAPFRFTPNSTNTIATIHDVFAWSCPAYVSRVNRLIYRNWLPRVINRIDKIITDSTVSRDDIIHFLNIPTERIHIIPLAISPLYRPVSVATLSEFKQRYGLYKPYLLFAGGIGKRKNLQRLLLACAQLWHNGEQRLLVVTGISQQVLDQFVALLHEPVMKGMVRAIGYIPERDLPALYNGADLFLFPSLYEGFGLPPLEAMACGTPVITSNVSSLPEVVGDAGVMVDPYNVEALAAAITEVLNDRQLRTELRRRGLERAALFTWERTARETLAVYEQAMQDAKSGIRRTERKTPA